MAVSGLCCWAGFSSRWEQGLLSSCGVQVYYCGGFSLQSTDSGAQLSSCVTWAHLSRGHAPRPGSPGQSQTRDWTHVPCIGRQILYHWATREALTKIILVIVVKIIFKYITYFLALTEDIKNNFLLLMTKVSITSSNYYSRGYLSYIGSMSLLINFFKRLCHLCVDFSLPFHCYYCFGNQYLSFAIICN